MWGFHGSRCMKCASGTSFLRLISRRSVMEIDGQSDIELLDNIMTAYSSNYDQHPTRLQVELHLDALHMQNPDC